MFLIARICNLLHTVDVNLSLSFFPISLSVSTEFIGAQKNLFKHIVPRFCFKFIAQIFFSHFKGVGVWLKSGIPYSTLLLFLILP